MITKWLKDSGLAVNESKTELCLFHRNDKPIIEINFLGHKINSKKFMNVLGVMFEGKLDWHIHISEAIKKATRTIYALRLIKKYFTPTDMRVLLDSYFYSTLYYNASVWLTSSIKSD